jgi:capsular polysaccharide biosynthesis protein
MSEQALDLESVLSTMRRHRRLLAALTITGALVGASLVRVHPPMYASSVQVLLPTPPTASNGIGRDSATDVRVALSDVVVRPAGDAVVPRLTPSEVRDRVTVDAPSPNVLRLTAKGATPASAEALAGALAKAETAYQVTATSTLTSDQKQDLEQRTATLQEQLHAVTKQIEAAQRRLAAEEPGSKHWQQDATSVSELTAQQGQLSLRVENLKEQATPASTGPPAQVIVQPTPAKRSDLVLWTVVAMLLGALLALGCSTLVLSIMSRRDRRLRTRDEVADAVGSAVIGSVRARPQRVAAGWSALLERYEPSVTEAWSLRQALDHVGLGDLTVRSGQERTRAERARSRALTLVTLSDDPRGLAVGPQIASHAAALGLRTRLVPKQGHESSSVLWAACSSLRRNDEVRPGLHVDTRRRKGLDDLTVELVVVDRKNPQFVSLDSNSVTLLAVASSSATAEDLARTAVAAYEAGGRISGVIVADPDTLDRSTGRLLLQQRSEQMPLPHRMTGLDPTLGEASGEGGAT